MIKVHYILFLVLFPLTLILPQQNDKHPDEVKYPVYMDKSTALISMKKILPAKENEVGEGKVIPNHIRPTMNKNIIKNENFRDPAAQNQFGPLQTTGTITNFDGMSNACSCSFRDPNGDVGPNHIIQSVNTQFQIWNKTGTSLYGPANLSTLWSDVPGPWVGTNDGDPIVLYDQLADRWLISQFSLPNYPNGPFYQLIAISSTSNPLGTYNRYIYTFTDMGDYPKIGVWSDGYYMSTNIFASGSGTFKGTGAYVMERDSMLAGKTARIVSFTTTTSDIAWSFLPSDLDGKILPPAGTPNYFMMEVDGVDWDGGADRLISRALHVDWSNTAYSTFRAPVNINVASFDENMCSFSQNCIPQSGTSKKLDAISDRLMHRLQYRNFGSYQSIVANQTVDVGSDHAGIRWYELRNTGSGWTVYQQGTYAPDATHRWMGSVAMDGDGNIAAGYSNSSSTTYPSIKYTGRYKGDAAGSFTLAEQSIKNGTGSQTGTAYRWGDYSMMTVDPSHDATFWYINEYYSATSTNSWKTRIASFKISSLALSSPVGGEFWTNNSVHNITWTATGVSNVKLEYTTDNGTTWNNIVASTSGSTGSYAWTLPALSYDLVKVRITDLFNSSLIGQSTNYFSVADYTSTLSPATGSSSSTTFTGTGITFTGNVNVSSSVTVNYYSKNIAAGTLPTEVKIVSPYFWGVTNSGTTFTNGKMIVPLSFLSGVGNSSSLKWLKRTNKADAWTNIGGTVNGSNLESNVAFSSFSEFAIGSVDSTNFVPVLILNLTALLQARYNGSVMVPDSVTVELHDASSLAQIDQDKELLSSSGTGTFTFHNAINGTNYYIAVKHRNSIETWSATTPSFTSGALNYDFTTAQSQAYGNNLTQFGTKWCIYTGDINQDGYVNLTDLLAVNNDAYNQVTGYVETDLTGDLYTNLSDLIIVNNNAFAIVSKIVPPGVLVSQKSRQQTIFENKSIIINNKPGNIK